MSNREHKEIIGVARMDRDRVIVEYSDNSSAVYTADQLATLAPAEVSSKAETDKKEGRPL